MSNKDKPLAIVVTGGRTFGVADYGDASPRSQRQAAEERNALNTALDRITPRPVILMHGAAKGADTLAGVWARRKGVEVREFPADWRAHGKAAGPKRNEVMLNALVALQSEGYRVGVVAFSGGTGTANCTAYARWLGIPVWEPCAEKQKGTPMK